MNGEERAYINQLEEKKIGTTSIGIDRVQCLPD